MSSKAIDRDELRKLVRQALREALGEDAGALPVSGRPTMGPSEKRAQESRRTTNVSQAGASLSPRVRADAVAHEATKPALGGLMEQMRQALGSTATSRIAVDVGSTEDLGRFARDILAASRHSDLAKAIETGRIRFEPSRAGRPASSPPERSREGDAGSRQGAFEMDAGVLSEAALVRIARGHSRILIGADVVVTPLAREKARAMKVEIERRKP